MRKKLLLVVIDALSSHVVMDAVRSGALPQMQKLCERGTFREQCISVFPSITPAATSSIATGRYPQDHGITGAYFYDTDEDSVRYFGADFWVIVRENFSPYFEDFLVRLNRDFLRSRTVFEVLEQAGLEAACVNYMIFRGQHSHDADMPFLLKLWPGLPFSERVLGPKLLYAGDFITGRPKDNAEELSGPGGLFRRFGFRDETTAAVLLDIAKNDAWLDFTLGYFPDNDFESHSVGPQEALSTVQRVDEQLGNIFEACGGLDSFLQSHAIAIVGDHGQSELVADKTARGIDLSQLLSHWELVDAGSEWTDREQIMVCPNMRACQIYLRRGHEGQVEKIASQLLTDERVDQVIWWTPDERQQPSYHVATRDRGRLIFARADEESAAPCHDDYGNWWSFSGDLASVAARVDQQGRLEYADYPNALERIACSFTRPVSGDMWVTAKLGHEFMLPETNVQNAGSHGSLHALDSTTPLILAGLPDTVRLPQQIRITDVAPLCARALGVDWPC